METSLRRLCVYLAGVYLRNVQTSYQNENKEKEKRAKKQSEKKLFAAVCFGVRGNLIFLFFYFLTHLELPISQTYFHFNPRLLSCL